MRPIDAFNDGRSRAEHLLKLAEVLTNTRQRAARADWKVSFRNLMHWPTTREFERVDGEHAILILPIECGLRANAFQEEYLSELLRSALVAMVSALDRYCHEVVTKALMREFRNGNTHVRKLEISLKEIEEVLLRAEEGRRPRNALRNALQARLYKETYQTPAQIADALRLAGKTDIWNRCATSMNSTREELVTKLNKIIARHNRIVHEGDLVRHERAGGVRRHDIQPAEVSDLIAWISDLVAALELL